MDAVEDMPPSPRGTAMMVQNDALCPHLDARTDVAFSLRMRGVERSDRHAQADDLLRIVDSRREFWQ